MTLVTGDVLADRLPVEDGEVQTTVTSPPYWGQRDYGYPEQSGMEETFDQYLTWWDRVARELFRVTRPDGSLWVVVGDTFNTRAIIRPSAHQGGLGHDNENIRLSWAEARDRGNVRYSARQPGLKDKDLMGLPWRMAGIAQDAGWWLRCDVIWSKLWGTPEKAHDRPSRSHEYIFMLARGKRTKFHKTDEVRKSIWEIAPSNTSNGPAPFPEQLVERCVLASTDPGDIVLDPFGGSGTTARVALRHGRRSLSFDAAPQSLVDEWCQE